VQAVPVDDGFLGDEIREPDSNPLTSVHTEDRPQPAIIQSLELAGIPEKDLPFEPPDIGWRSWKTGSLS
jgi:hypothetical protein